jgi:hypothetical protein
MLLRLSQVSFPVFTTGVRIRVAPCVSLSAETPMLTILQVVAVSLPVFFSSSCSCLLLADLAFRREHRC